MRGAYYNENDKFKAATLRLLIEEGVIAHGVVDERAIQEVRPEDLRGYAQCHFFAGGGIWSYALRLAGVPDDRPLWTGSCPCGPFSAAGKKRGFEDPRHLWPAWVPLIRECRPDLLFGEQSDDAHEWIDLVATDMEDIGYAFGSPDIPAGGFGGAHIRQRYYWVADANNAEWWAERAPWHDGDWPKTGRVQGNGHAGHGGPGGWLGDADSHGLHALARDDGEVRRLSEAQRQSELGAALSGGPGEPLGLGDAIGPGLEGRDARTLGRQRQAPERASGLERLVYADRVPGVEGCSLIRGGNPGGDANLWPGLGRPGDVEWLFCRDGSWRPTEPGLSPLVDASARNLHALRLFGDAIDAEAAANFIAAYLDCAPASELIARAILQTLEERVG